MIDGPAITGPVALSAPEFMALPYRASSTAVWTCPQHGTIGRVTVSVIDDFVAFVDPEAPLSTA